MSNWINELKENLATEFDHKFVVATLATVRSDAAPDARSVVVRNLLEDGRMWITSDARSEKNQQLKLNPSATLVLWLPSLRKQFRIDGKLAVLRDEDPLRLEAWKGSSDSSRALFFWPPPGQPFVETEFARTVEKDRPMPNSFEVLQLSPTHADVLDLKPHPHLRLKWSLNSGLWIGSRINP